MIKLISSIKSSGKSTIRGWYTNKFPTDELGVKITEGLTFNELETRMKAGEEVYSIIGVGDSLVRERIFSELAVCLGIDYDDVYDLWRGE